MAYDEGLAQRIREVMVDVPNLVEKKMFGGLAFMVQGNLACGVQDDEMIVRVGPDNYEDALAQAHTRPFDFTGRPMKGWVMVSADGCEADVDLENWVQRGVDFARSLPAK